jgi:hypothetical protein
MRIRDLAARLVLAAILAAATIDVAAAQAKLGPLNVSVKSPDGTVTTPKEVRAAPIGESRESQFDEKGEFNPTDAGRVVIVYVTDDKGNKGTASTFVPEGETVDITIDAKADSDFDGIIADAQDAKNNDDKVRFQSAIDRAKQRVDDEEGLTRQVATAINSWAIANKIPIMDLPNLKKRIKRAETDPAREPVRVDNLRAYQAKLEDLEGLKQEVTDHKKTIEEMKPPLMGSHVPPSTCPEGQSGGFLAGVLNSVTGTNSLTGICDEEIDKDNKDRKPRDREDDRHH